MSKSQELTLEQLEQVDQIADQFEQEFKAGESPRIESFLSRYPELRQGLLRELMRLEKELRTNRGEAVSYAEFAERFPGDLDLVGSIFTSPADPQRPVRVRAGAQGRPKTPSDLKTESGAAADRNLLFGILAVQMDFIDRDQLISAMHAWVLEKSKSLEDILSTQGALPDEEKALLTALVEKHIRNHDNDPGASLAVVSSVGSLRHELSKLADKEIEASLVQVSARRGDEAPLAETMSVGVATSAGDRFRVLRPHAQGGLGSVSVALDDELNREVALKEILPQYADYAEARSRFVLEAEITGGLEHPGIVPIYGLGTYADGRPFYAMRFIRGHSLKEAIGQFHGTSTSAANKSRRSGFSSGERSVEFRKLLGRFIDVCNALQYAHSRGVLHRDLKPGNIMLGKYGETLVVDWGLAKAAGRDEPYVTDDESTLQPRSGSGSAPTQLGTAVGTPAYMSPEQAEGKLHEFGPRTDVYGLGATLYCLLTGTAPITEADKAVTLNRVRSGSFPRPSEINSAVPKALEAICLKAMSLNTADRYKDPSELAADIERWMADESVSAYADPVGVRAARWMNRHRSLVAGVSAAMLVLLTSLIAGNLLLGRANRQVLASAAEARNAASRANEERDKAVRAREQEIEAKNNHALGLAEGHLQRGIQLGERGLVPDAILAFTKALGVLPADSGPIERVVRLNLSSWGERLCPIQTMVEPSGRVTHVEFGGTGTWFVTASNVNDDKFTIQRWDTETGDAIGSRFVVNGKAAAINLSPSGESLAVGTVDRVDQLGTIAIRNLITGKPMFEHVVPDGVRSVSFNTRGDLVAVGCFDGYLRVYVAQSGKLLYAKKHEGPVAFVTCDRNLDDWVCIAGTQVSVYDASSGDARGRPISITNDPFRRYPAALSPDGALLAVGGFKEWFSVWNVSNGGLESRSFDHQNEVSSVAYSPDGQLIVTGSRDSTAQIREASTGRLMSVVRHGGAVNDVGFDATGRRFATASADGTCRIWSVPPFLRNHPRIWTSTASSGAVDASEGVLYSGHKGGSLKQYDLQARKSIGEFSAVAALPDERYGGSPYSMIHRLELRDGRSQLAVSSRSARCWDLQTMSPMTASVRGDGSKYVHASTVPERAEMMTAAVNSLQLWNIETGEEIADWKSERMTNGIQGMTSVDAQTVAFATNTDLGFFDRNTGSIRWLPRTLFSGIVEFALSPDGQLVAAADNTGAVFAFGVESGDLESSVIHDGDIGVRITFSRDGDRFAVAGEDSVGRVWDTSTSLPLTPPIRFNGVTNMFGVAFAPQDGILFLGSQLRRVPIPQLAVGRAQQLEMLVQRFSAQSIDELGGMVALNRDQWLELGGRVNASEGETGADLRVSQHGVASIEALDQHRKRRLRFSKQHEEKSARDMAVVFPQLEHAREVPDWGDAPVTGEPIESDIIEALRGAHGIVEERFVVCQSLPSKEFDHVAAALDRSGYSLRRFRPYMSKDQILVVAIWDRTGIETRLEHGLTGPEITSRDKELRREGFLPVDIAGFSTRIENRVAIRFSCLWHKSEKPVPETDVILVVGAAVNSYRDLRDRRMREGYIPDTATMVVNGLGHRRFCGIWKRERDWITPHGGFDLSLSIYAAGRRADYIGRKALLKLDSDLCPTFGPADRNNRLESMRVVAERALEANADNHIARIGLAEALYRLGEYERAGMTLEPIFNLDQTELLGKAHRVKALCAAALENEADARRHYKEFVRRIDNEFEHARVDAFISARLGDDNPSPLSMKPDERESDDGTLSYRLAATYATLSQIAKDRTDVELAAIYRIRAVEFLQSALDKGSNNYVYFATDPDLFALRGDDAFETLMQEYGYDYQCLEIWRGSDSRASVTLPVSGRDEHLRRIERLTKRGYRPASISVAEILSGTVVATSVWHVPVGPDWMRPTPLALKRTERLIGEVTSAQQEVTAVELAKTDSLSSLVSNLTSPTERAIAINQVGKSTKVSLSQLGDALTRSKESGEKRFWLLCIAARAKNLPPETAFPNQLKNQVGQLLLTDDDAGVHAAAVCLLRRIGERDWIRQVHSGVAKEKAIPQQRNWYVSPRGQQMIILEANRRFNIGSPVEEPGHIDLETPTYRTIWNRTAIAATEVSVNQYHEFDPKYSQPGGPESPVTSVSWYQAAAFCNWLSEQEGIPQDQWCYLPNEDGEYASGMWLAPQYLGRVGYRLPTEREWECACRAGTSTSRFCGDSAVVIDDYAWVESNSDRRAGLISELMPNPFGCFDMLGNASEWCQNVLLTYPNYTYRTILTSEIVRHVTDDAVRVVRGGSFTQHHYDARAAYRDSCPPHYARHGFRVARTLPPFNDDTESE